MSGINPKLIEKPAIIQAEWTVVQPPLTNDDRSSRNGKRLDRESTNVSEPATSLGRTDPQKLRELVSPASGHESLTVMCAPIRKFFCLRQGPVPALEWSRGGLETGAGSHPLSPAVRRWCLTNDSLLPTNFQSNGQPQPAQYFLRIASQEAPRAP